MPKKPRPQKAGSFLVILWPQILALALVIAPVLAIIVRAMVTVLATAILVTATVLATAILVTATVLAMATVVMVTDTVVTTVLEVASISTMAKSTLILDNPFLGRCDQLLNIFIGLFHSTVLTGRQDKC